jgi:acetolactate synthase small subunit
MLQTFAIEIGNHTLAFERVVSVVRRRAFEIRSLTLRGTRRTGVARIVFAVEADERNAQRLEDNLWKLQDVIGVNRRTSLFRLKNMAADSRFGRR